MLSAAAVERVIKGWIGGDTMNIKRHRLKFDDN